MNTLSNTTTIGVLNPHGGLGYLALLIQIVLWGVSHIHSGVYLDGGGQRKAIGRGLIGLVSQFATFFVLVFGWVVIWFGTAIPMVIAIVLTATAFHRIHAARRGEDVRIRQFFQNVTRRPEVFFVLGAFALGAFGGLSVFPPHSIWLALYLGMLFAAFTSSHFAISGARRTADIRAGVVGGLAAVLNVSEGTLENDIQWRVNKDGSIVTGQLPGYSAIRVGDKVAMAERCALALPHLMIGSVSEQGVTLIPVDEKEAARRNHYSKSDGLVAGVDEIQTPAWSPKEEPNISTSPEVIELENGEW